MKPQFATALLYCQTLALLAAGPSEPAKTEFVQGTSKPPAVAPLGDGAELPAVGGSGYRFTLTNGVAKVPVAVVSGTPFEMGWHLGRLMKVEMEQFLPPVVAGFQTELHLTDEQVDQVWATTSAYTDDRVEQEILGMAQGSGLPLRLLQHAHCLPLLMPYSCSSIAAWGAATADGHLYQTRDLDWSLEAGAHRFPLIAVFIPDQGIPQVLPTFAGIVGANCGMNAAGIVLSEIGDASAREMPYNLRAPHFTTWFRTILYDADSLSAALDVFKSTPPTKRYHFVFGDGLNEKRAVKIRAHSPEPVSERIRIWKDADPSDELAPSVLGCTVYQDEGRGAFPILKKAYGHLDGPSLIALANRIPIKGGNVLDAVFDATALRLWVSYAGQDEEAYQRPYVFLDLRTLGAGHDGQPVFSLHRSGANLGAGAGIQRKSSGLADSSSSH